MGLPPPVEREAFHHRRIAVDGYRRSDGLWDIEAHMTDTKSYGFENDWRGRIEPGEPLHDMWLRVTLDDAMVVRDVVAAADAHPFRICPEITGNFRALIGETVGAGWSRRVRRPARRRRGLHPSGRPARADRHDRVPDHQIGAGQGLAKRDKPKDRSGPRPRPMIIDTCHRFAERRRGRPEAMAGFLHRDLSAGVRPYPPRAAALGVGQDHQAEGVHRPRRARPPGRRRPAAGARPATARRTHPRRSRR